MGQKVFFQSILSFSLCACTANVIYFGLLSLKPGFFTFRKRLSLCNFPREWTKTNSLKLNHTRGFWSLQWPILQRNHPPSARLVIGFDLKPSQHPQHTLLAIFSLPTFDLFGSSLQSPNRFFHCYGLEMHERVDSSKTAPVSALMFQIQFYGTKYDSAWSRTNRGVSRLDFFHCIVQCWIG